MTTIDSPMTTTVHELRGQAGRRSRGAVASAALAAALLVAGCGVAMKFGYAQAAPLAYRWLDGFVEFEPKQETRVRGALDDFMAWHRRTQLRDYVQLLSKAEAEIAGDATPERMCGWVQDVRSRLDALVERAMPTMVEVLPTLQAHQIANVQKTQAERNEDWRNDYLQRDMAKRKREAVKRETDRAESLYGRLDREQKALIEKSVLESPLEGERSYALRLRRQQDLLETLRRVAAPGIAPKEAEAQIRGYLKRVERSPREEDRRYAQQVTDYNCAFAATLHNTTTPTQRQHAAKKLRGYGEDFRALAGGPAS
jgi:hypothetical protein